MRTPLRLLLLLALMAARALQADVAFERPGWAINAAFPAAPKTDEVRIASEQGDIVVERFFYDQGSTRCMLARFNYPVVPLVRLQEQLYDRSIEEMMRSRPGQTKGNGPIALGEYTGRQLVLLHRREKTVREVRQFLIGASLIVVSAEWPGTGEPTPEVARFLKSVAVRPEFADPRRAEEGARWREVVHGKFRVRYDATRWYRDPSDREPGVFNFLRVDQQAEAQLIAEPEPLAGGASMGDAVLQTARENAESVVVRRTGKKTRGSVVVDEIEYTARVEGVTYVNHGYFYSGPAGAVQLRAWSPDKTYVPVSGDIEELLAGLSITP